MIFSAPTVSANTRTLMASYDSWKEVIPRLDQALARRIEQQIMRNRKQPLIRVEFTAAEASIVLAAANKG